MENVGLDFYRGKRVFVTGHTGFKGAWLCWWLHQLGAEVTAYALPPENFRGNLFEASGLADVITSVEGDLSDRTLLSETMVACQPDMVFHLAAQPLVLAMWSATFYLVHYATRLQPQVKQQQCLLVSHLLKL